MTLESYWLHITHIIIVERFNIGNWSQWHQDDTSLLFYLLKTFINVSNKIIIFFEKHLPTWIMVMD